MNHPSAVAKAALATLCLLPPLAFAQTSEPSLPACRLSADLATSVEATLRLALQGYKDLGKPLPFDAVVVNPPSKPSVAKTLAAYIVTDATRGSVDANGCITKSPATVKGEELDPISVRGGCVASATGGEVRCSADALKIFAKVPSGTNQQNPALLYVLAHELGHIQQGLQGEYAGRLEVIDLAAPSTQKLQMLQAACVPGLKQAEADADRQAVEVLVRLLPQRPFREPMFSQRGSVLWGVDQLNLAANTWSELALEREFMSQPDPHKAFVPTEFPTPAAKVQANAKRFVCEVLTKKKGLVSYPGRSGTHPALEVRIQRAAEALRPLAATLPSSDGSKDYQPVAILQRQLSDIFTFMYRESGVYLQGMQSAVCTRVNSDKPTAGC